MRLIDADKLLEELNKAYLKTDTMDTKPLIVGALNYAKNLVNEAPDVKLSDILAQK